MSAITITEALAEIKTIGKRIDTKRSFVNQHLARQEGVKDPLAAQGGSTAAILAERQGIADLEERVTALRRGIRAVNEETTITINGVTRYISDWLTWRRDIAPSQKQWLKQMQDGLNNIREKAKREGNAIFAATLTTTEAKPTDVVVSIDELALAKEIEQLEDTLGQLDGQLSLKNATVTFTV